MPTLVRRLLRLSSLLLLLLLTLLLLLLLLPLFTPDSLFTSGGIYFPTQNRIYLVPSDQAKETTENFHFIDAATGSVVEYHHSLTQLPANTGFTGAALSPSQNRVYLMPYKQAPVTGNNWHYITDESGASLPNALVLPSYF
jgi:hypothetical protein